MLKRPSPHAESAQPKAERRKRVKSGAACTQCRKNKTRCELPSGDETRCHRCRILSLSCSIEHPDLLNPEPVRPVAPAPESSRSRYEFKHILHPPPEEDSRRPTHQHPYQHTSHSHTHSHSQSHPYSHPPSRMPVVSTPVPAPDFVKKPAHRSAIHVERTAFNDKMHAPSQHVDSWDSSERRVPSQHPWSDPMATMQALVGRSRPVSSSTADGLVANSEILNQSQIESLSELFEKHFAPWIGLPIVRPTHPPPFWLDNFLTLSRCAVACRLLPQQEVAPVLPHLIKLVEHAVLLKTFNVTNSASLEGVEALLILAVWLPTVSNTSSEVLHDATVLATWSVKMALVLKLDQAAEQAVGILTRARKSGKLTATDKESYEEAMYDARLWSVCCDVESRLATGTSRAEISFRSKFDHQAFDWQRFSGSGSVQGARDFRLGLAAQIDEAVTRGCSIKLRNLHSFAGEINEILTLLSEARNVLLPLQSMAPPEREYIDVLMVTQYHGRLLVICHALSQARAWVAAHRDEAATWATDSERAAFDHAKIWGIEYHTAAQSILTTFFNLYDKGKSDLLTPSNDNSPLSTGPAFHPLSAAPDVFFTSVLLAASSMVVARYVVVHQYQNRRRFFIDTADAMLLRLVEALDIIALSKEHAPRRAAIAVRRLRGLWREKTVKPVLGTSISVHPINGRKLAGSTDADSIVGVDDTQLLDKSSVLDLGDDFASSSSGETEFNSVPTLAFEAASNAGMWGDIVHIDKFWSDFIENAEGTYTSVGAP